ncbi:MAG: beta-ketoacyl synthase chain length factor [Parvibaculum sp.]|uniref:beta-ketoacyl synthase chain length factor n=1 Tax=Parvibaculum sp. TaxID=2024848 RepID=UPI0034A05376
MQIDRMQSVPAGLSAAYVESWAAILPASANEPERRLGDCADETSIPAGLKRRMQPMARMGVACGLGVAPKCDADIVFCSRYGDIALAHQLLVALVGAEPMSPAGFSMSVHNTVPGILDLVRKARIGHTAVAAGTQTLSAGLTEAWLRLGKRPHLKLVLVFVDLPLPNIYSQFVDCDTGGVAFALCLSAEREEQAQISLVRSSDTGSDASALDSPHAELLARNLISSLQNGVPAVLRWRSQGSLWSFGRNPDAAD